MSCAAQYNPCFWQGTDWVIPFSITQDGSPLSLAGATITAKLRRAIDGAVVETWTGTVTSGPLGTGQIALSAAETAALTYESQPDTEDWDPTIFFYDVLITLAGGTVIAPFAGQITAYPAVSR